MLDQRLQAGFSHTLSSPIPPSISSAGQACTLCVGKACDRCTSPCGPCAGGPEFQASEDGLITLVQAVIAEMLRVTLDEMKAPSRGKARVAFARQLAMYVCHVMLSFDQGRLAGAFCRDRTTVSHGVRRIEARRDHPLLDDVLETLEEIFRDKRKDMRCAGCSCPPE